MSKSLILVLMVVFSICTGLWAYAQQQDDLKELPECKYCGMNRKHFAHSRLLLEHKGGRFVGVCSINCASIDFIRDLNDPPCSVKVGDYKTRSLISVENAYWVIGGIKPGVMAQRAKWAFEKEKDAKSFINEYGGKPASYDEAMRASYEDIYEDMRKLKQMKQEHARSK